MRMSLPARFSPFVLTFLLLAAGSSGLSSVALAHEPPMHPAYKVAEKYIRASHLHQWTYAVKMIESRSLENLKVIQKRFLLNAPTIPDEEELLRRLGLSDVSGLDELTPEEVFIRRAAANTRDLPDPEAHIAQMEKSLKLTTLTTARENDDLVHVLMRVSYIVKTRAIAELALVSLIKEGTVWKISLDAQEPTVTPVNPPKR